MSLHITQSLRIDVGFLEGIENQIALSIRIGNRIAVGFSTMIDAARFDHRVYLISIAESVLQRLEQNGPHPFSRYVSIPSCPKASASAVACRKLSLAQTEIFIRMDREIDAACNGRIDISFPKFVARQMNCSQGRRAHGIQRDAGTMKVEEVRNPISD